MVCGSGGFLEACSPTGTRVMLRIFDFNGMRTLYIPLIFYPSMCTWICPDTSCAVWQLEDQEAILSKLSKLLGMTMCLLPVSFVMLKMLCEVNSMLSSNVYTPSASAQAVPVY
eukprot:484416-Pelagomonas_calceolata.AAC.6